MIITHPNPRRRSLDELIADFLADLAHSNRSVHTRRAYAADLARFSSFYRGAVEDITADALRAFFATHAHATELVNGGVSLATIRKRLRHKNLRTTLRYAAQSDAAADTELRAWRRGHG